jgi:phage baseplate assembly protein W
MAQITTTRNSYFSDLDLNFNIHPVRKDIVKHRGDMAILNSVKNLVLLNFYEKPFHPEIGSNIRKLLFENLDSITAIALGNQIKQVIDNFEPRIELVSVSVDPDYDNNGFRVSITFNLINSTVPMQVEFFLERLR